MPDKDYGDYLRVKNITLSYALPSSVVSKLNISQLRIYASAVNAFTFHDVDFWDPVEGLLSSDCNPLAGAP